MRHQDRSRTIEARAESVRRASIRAVKYSRARSVDSIRASLQAIDLIPAAQLATIDGTDTIGARS